MLAKGNSIAATDCTGTRMCSGFFGLVQQLPQIRQFVEVGLFRPTKIGWPPRWSAGGALMGSPPLHDPFCQVQIFLI